MHVTRSRTGKPIVAESGGGMTNTGTAVIICGPQGERLTPMFVPRGYSNGDHALFVAEPGMCIVKAHHSRSGEWAGVSSIVEIGTDDDPDEITRIGLGEYENGDGDIPAVFETAVAAALEKSKCYHCREAHYVKKPGD